jgi:hypothetical protein
MAVKDIKDVLDAAVRALPPLLQDDDWTVQRFYLAHKGELTSEAEARELLEQMAQDGILARVECRSGKGGTHPIAYRLPVK